MKKNVYGRKLKRDKNERQALFKSLMSSLVMEERIQTSDSKAKAIKPEMERLVTKAKKGGNSSLKVLEQSLSKPAFDKIVKDIAQRFLKRNGGYTRIVRVGNRLGDDSPVVLMEWVEGPTIVPVSASSDVKKTKVEKIKTKKPAKRKTTTKVAAKKPARKAAAKTKKK